MIKNQNFECAYLAPRVKMVTLGATKFLCGSKDPINYDWNTEDYGTDGAGNYNDTLFD